MGAGGSNHSSPDRDGRPSYEPHGPAGVGRGAGGVAQVAAGQAAATEAIGQVAAVPRVVGVSRTGVPEGDRPVVAVAGLGRAAERAEHVGDIVVGIGERRRGTRDVGIVVGQLLVDRQRRAELGLRLRQPAGLPTAAAEAVVARPPGGCGIR